jgi:hypothetical protein
MPARRHTKESIIQTLTGLAKSLGKDTLTIADVQKVIPVSSVNNNFGSLGAALNAAGLRAGSSTDHLSRFRHELSDDELFTSICEAERIVGREPTSREYSANGSFSLTPLRRRYGKWSDVLAHYRRWKKQRANLELSEARTDGESPLPAHEPVTGNHQLDRIPPAGRTPRAVPVQLFGEPIDFRGLRHAPINEQGVVYVFGMVSRELGFYIEAVQQGFPDCEGKYLYDKKKSLWAKARIEFEFKSSNFRLHGHDANQCDFIVCWENDWPDCPIEVIELRKEILKLPPR